MTTIVGRETERRDLARLLRDPDVRLVVLRGPGGAGKTALAGEALEAMRRDGALVGAGDYAEDGADRAFGPLMQALSHAVDAALEQLYDTRAGLDSLQQSLGPALEILRETGFRAESPRLAGRARPALGRRDSGARVAGAAVGLLRWLEGFGLPLVLFLDDWRRASPEARACVDALLARAGETPLTILIADRDEPGGAGPPLAAPAVVVDLGPLDAADRERLLGDHLGDPGKARAALPWLDQSGALLPFEVIEAARSLLQADGLVLDEGAWRLDLPRLVALGAGSEEALRRRVTALPCAARELLLAAALWGGPVPAEILRVAADRSPEAFEGDLRRLNAEGFLAPSRPEIRFRHDRSREAVLAAHPPQARAEAAGRLAERLLALPLAPDDLAFAASLNLRLQAGLDAVAAEPWRERFAQGARAARVRGDSESAVRFAEAALRLLDSAPGSDAAAVRLVLGEAALAAADRQDAVAVLERVHRLCAVPGDPVSRAEARALGVLALRLSGDNEAAWRIGREGLAELGVEVPDQARLPALLASAALWRLSRLASGRKRPDAAAAARIEALTLLADACALPAYERSAEATAVLAMRVSAAVRPYSATAPYWCAVDAFICSSLGDFAGAARLGAMALTGADHPGGLRANTLYRAVFFGLIWRRFGGDLREQCSRVAQLALAEGDLMTFGTAVRNGAVLGWRLAPSLREFAGELERLAADLIWLGDPALNAGVQEIRDAVSLVLDPAAPQRLRERWETLPAAPVNPLLEIELAVLSGDWVMAAALADRLRPFRRRFDNHPGGLLWRFYETLARLKTGRSVPRRDVALLERGARLSPDHGGPMMALIRAELRRRRGDPEAVMPLYAAAAEAAAQGPRPLVAGLAAECAADAARSFGRQDAARRFARQAAAVWSGWGAAWKLPRATPANEAGPEQETLIEAEARAAVAERADRAKARLLADVAHELRTPLQALQGLLDLAAEGGRPADPETLRDLLEGLRSVVDDLTEYGAQATGQSALALRPVAMADLLRTEASIAAGLRKDAAVELDCAPDLPGWVQTDPVRVRQVVRNLLANAVRHGGGTVRLRARHEPGAQDALTLHLVVEDSGPGIPPGQLRRLFEPFERGDTQAEGFGLGLAVASQLARRLGGALTAWNRPEGGAAFGFTLPTTLAPPPAAEAGGRVRTLRILLAEDQDLIRSSLAAILRADGHEVEAVGDGDAAGEALAGQPFDLAVVDLRMPGRNGLEVLAGASREGPRRPSFILLTASTDPEVERRGLAAGAAAVLRKPVSANELRTLIGALFGDAPPGEPAEADLSREAAERLRLQLPDLLRSLQTPGDRAEAAEAAHRVAGLAAQFGWPEVAAACDALERDLRAGAAPGAALRGLERAGRAAGLLPQPA